MKVILFGATGMVGQGVLRECLIDPGVTSVLSVGRSPTGQHHAKLREIVHGDFTNFAAIEPELTGYDACLFCLGVSSIGMDAERYRHLTYDITMAAATTLVKLNPQMVFTYVTGRSTDSTEQGSLRWARVKGKPRTTCSSCRSRPLTCFVPPASSRCMACGRRPAGSTRSTRCPRRCCPTSPASRRVP
jgi:uncharacterized protein YbjT (DUF2867 family)